MAPTASPWGTPDHADLVLPGVWLVTTPGHGGLMLETAAARRLLSPAARAEADTRSRGFLSFEEDCALPLALVDCPELSEAYRQRYSRLTKEEFDASITESCAHWNPVYMAARAQRVARSA